jgi:hypothetical protein
MLMNNNITFVTGIWDLDRGSAKDNWNRSFDHYINHFVILLKEMKDHNLIIFVDPSLDSLVWEHRSPNNTRIFHHTKDQFSGNFFPFFDKVQEIRNNPVWYNQVGWLKDSTQASLEYYNPMVMSKMFLLNNARVFDPFNSECFFWIDGGLNNTMSLGYFNNPQVIQNLIKASKKFIFAAFPYVTNTEIHGFGIEGMKKFSNSPVVDRVARGGFFGGHRDTIADANRLYYSLLNDTLNEGFMGTEESIFTIMTYLDPITYNYELINPDGLIFTFFEKLKRPNYRNKNHKETNLYINAFNSPEQLLMVLDSFQTYEPSFLTQTKLVLINNSTNETLFDRYDQICSQYNMEQIRQGNIGICGARQLSAEHFNESPCDYMLFFEDDMLLDYKEECRFGFKKKVKNLYENIIHIMNKEHYDFLKLSFSEFYGHNGEQWSWHNIPSDRRNDYFGNLGDKPPTRFNNIKTLGTIPYADGEIYYSNWPHIINKEGNKKCFLIDFTEVGHDTIRNAFASHTLKT